MPALHGTARGAAASWGDAPARQGWAGRGPRCRSVPQSPRSARRGTGLRLGAGGHSQRGRAGLGRDRTGWAESPDPSPRCHFRFRLLIT